MISTIPSNHKRYEVIRNKKLMTVCQYCDPTDGLLFGGDLDWRATCKCDERRDCEICKEQFIPISNEVSCQVCPNITMHHLSQFLKLKQ